MSVAIIDFDMSAAHLRRAADRIEKLGWRQDENGDEHGPNCAVGALNETGSWLSGCDAVKSVLDYLDLFFSHNELQNRLTLSDWNDVPSRTKDEVLDALCACADALEAG